MKSHFIKKSFAITKANSHSIFIIPKWREDRVCSYFYHFLLQVLFFCEKSGTTPYCIQFDLYFALMGGYQKSQYYIYDQRQVILYSIVTFLLGYLPYTWDMLTLNGRNHVNETARHGIIAHRLWEENLGNITEVFVNYSFVFIARSLWFRCPNAAYLKKE